ncbi:MAG: Uma2 family endonuclease [Gemmataceae bacterium]|nr:Uma2 family endonuclease [Gemmataceae bacterium]
MSAILTRPPAAATVTPEVTPEDLLRMGGEGDRYELIDGHLEERNVSFQSSYVAGEVYDAIKQFIKTRNLGWLSPEGTGYQCFPKAPKKVRRADVSFIALARLTAAQATADGFLTVAPDLAVEVNSPNDTADEVTEKIEDWLGAGVPLVWEVAPKSRLVVCHRPDGSVTRRDGDTLTGDPVLPGFAVPVADLFRLPVEPAAG